VTPLLAILLMLAVAASALAQSTQPARDAQGFTLFPLDPNAREVYVSSSTGNDAGPGTQQSPLATLAKAVPVLRKGAGDHLYLKAGDAFTGPFPNIAASGLDATHPTLIGTYGSGPRPVVKVTGVVPPPAFGIDGRQPFSELAIVGVDFWCAARDPASPDFTPQATAGDAIFGRFIGPGGARGSVRGITVEDCVVRCFRMGPDFQGVDGVTFRRNIVIDCYGVKSQGLYLSACDNVIVEGNTFDRIGWTDDPRLPGFARNIYNHCLYEQTDCGPGAVVRNNVFSRASSHGCQLRGGGTLADNAFIDCPIAGFVGQSPSTMSGNLVVGGGDIANQQRGWGLQVNDCPTATVAGNLVCNKHAGVGTGWAYEIFNDTGKPCVVSWSNNAAYNWPAPALVSNPQGTPGSFPLNPGTLPADLAIPATFVPSLRSRARGAWDESLTPAALLAMFRAAVNLPQPTTQQLRDAAKDVGESVSHLQELIGRMK
jgi:hypothetical protein